jgi:acyl-CoA reductase-like NAD-dependent aldehyde dehydrogenase/nicotinamidase-related amidase
MRAALLLVDCQHDFLRRPCLRPSPGAIVDAAALLLQAARAAGSPVLHVRTTVSLKPDTRMPHWRREGRIACVEGTEGNEPPEALQERPNETVIRKTGFSARDLVEQVTRSGAEFVAVAGVMLHACVREAVLALHESGIAVAVVSDAVGSDDPVHAAITRRYLEARGVRFETAGDLATRWTASGVGDALGIGGKMDGLVAWSQSAVKKWSSVVVSEREKSIRRFQERLRADSESIALAIAKTLGKPIRFARIEVSRSVEMIDAIIARIVSGLADEPVGGALIRRRPLGTVAVITPWNNPVYIALGKLVPALLCGNSVIWKPAPEAEMVSSLLMDCFAAAGLPEGLLTRLPGDSRTGRQLVAATGIGGVSITGSHETGLSAWEACARNGVPLQAEMGGNNAAIVWSDADLEFAAEQVAAGAFDQAGQRCTANRRVIVEQSCVERFQECLIEAAKRLPWGDPLDPETRIGPIVSSAHLRRIEGIVRRAIAAGAEVVELRKEEAPATAGHWFAPVILGGAAPDSEIVQEETFGPVLVIQTAKDWEEAMALCNGVRQGLAAAIFTKCPERIERFLAEAQAGILKINASTADAAVDVPFGGWKGSGIGPPEHGDHDLEFYTRLQAVYV